MELISRNRAVRDAASGGAVTARYQFHAARLQLKSGVLSGWLSVATHGSAPEILRNHSFATITTS
jgi:outer membrane protein TolC